jgi:hypothetical protein
MIRSTLRNAIAVTILIVGFNAAATEAAQPPDEASATADTFTAKRMMASGAAVTGLIGAVAGALALTRSTAGTGRARRGAIVALALGSIGVVIGGLVVATAAGGVGTGNGVAGGFVAVFVGLIGMTTGGFALVRSRRTT